MQTFTKIWKLMGSVAPGWKRLPSTGTCRWDLFIAISGLQTALCFVLFAYGFVAGGCLTATSLLTAIFAFVVKQRAAMYFHAVIQVITMFYFVIGTGLKLNGAEKIYTERSGIVLSVTQACLSAGFAALGVLVGCVDLSQVEEQRNEQRMCHASENEVTRGRQQKIDVKLQFDQANYFSSDEFCRTRDSILQGATLDNDMLSCQIECGDVANEFLTRLRTPPHLPILSCRSPDGDRPTWKSSIELEPVIKTFPSTSTPQLLVDNSPFAALNVTRVRSFESPKITTTDPVPSEPLPPTRPPVCLIVETSKTFCNDRRPTSAETTDLMEGGPKSTTEIEECFGNFVPV